MKNGDQYCILTPSGIERYDYKTGEKTDTIVDFSTLKFGNQNKNKIFAYTFSKDEKKILLAADPEFIYRHSFVAN